jgi:hypothetical protein
MKELCKNLSLKKFLCYLLVLASGMIGVKIYAQGKKPLKMDIGLQVTTLGEVGVFFAYQPFYAGLGMNLWAPDDFEGNLLWSDITMRGGYSHKFKTGVGILGGLQFRVLYASSKWGDLDNVTTHFIFMPEIGASYTLERFYGNVAFQFDTNNIKNSTVCFVIGGIF